jgi:hypothetical protein
LAYKLLISDVDGTLIDERKRIPPVNKEAVMMLKQKGYYFTLATGRMFNSAYSFINELEVDFPVIVGNGAQIVDGKTGKVIYEKKTSIHANILQKALLLCREYSFEPLIYEKDRIYVEKKNEIIEEHMKDENPLIYPVGDLSQFIDREVSNLLLIGSPEKFKPFQVQLEKSLASTVNIVQSGDTFLEILPTGVSKGDALVALATEFGLKLQDIIAIGDNQNDLEMVEKAGLGVASRNAHPQIINAADYVTEKDNNEGAVAEVIYEFFIAN